MRIMKFGGTSVGAALRMKEVAKLLSTDEPLVVVLSAVSGTTNALVHISESFLAEKKDLALQRISDLETFYRNFVSELFDQEQAKISGNALIDAHFNFIRSFSDDVFTPHEEKSILAQGELISTALFHIYLLEKNIKAILLPALDFMRTDENAEPDMKYISSELRLQLHKYPDQKLFITQGYVCRNAFGEVDNLKRGGSDYSASLIGAALQADEIQIWTDIDGMHNNDPRIVENTQSVAELSFDEAAELAYFGAKILHPQSIWPARSANIPVRLLNTMQPAALGTLITANAKGSGIKAVAAKDGITAIKIKSGRMLLAYGFLRSIFEIFENYKTPIDMITTSEVAVSLTIDNNTFLKDILNDLKKIGSVEVDEQQSIICVVGQFNDDNAGDALQIFQSLKEIPIRMISYGGSKNNISVLVNTKYKNDALKALHQGLFQN